MNDPLFVRGFERLGDLRGDRQRFIDRNRAACDTLRQIVAFDQFHHERGDAPALFEAVDRRDVWVIERSEDFRFALKARESFGIRRDRGWEDLDRDLTLQLRIGSPIHLSMPPSPILAVTS